MRDLQRKGQKFADKIQDKYFKNNNNNNSFMNSSQVSSNDLDANFSDKYKNADDELDQNKEKLQFEAVI